MQLQLFPAIWIIVQIFCLWLIADFITGLVHWWQDMYGNPTWLIIGRYVIAPNLRHHHDPRAMIKVSYWKRMNTSILAGVLICILCFVSRILSWQIAVFFLCATQGNEIHAIGHRTNKENGRAIIFLQKLGIIQRRKTHGWHHKAPYDTNFFVMTEYLNPLFNYIKFFEKLEWLIEKVCKIKPLRGAAIRDGV